jgi:hypothetical protein
MTDMAVEPKPYELYVSYDPETDDLAASLEFLSKIVSNQAKADKIMAQVLVESGLTTKIVLDDIQKSSIRMKIKNTIVNTIKNTSEDRIREKGVAAYLNQFLVEVRKPFLDYSSKHEVLEKRDDLKDIRQQVIQIAQTNNINVVMLEGMSDEHIAECLSNYSVPLGLGPKQEYKAICAGEEFLVNKKFKVTPDQISSVLNGAEQTFNDQIVYLKPKTAVYEGDGMWDFHESKSGKVIKGKILHEDWLTKFQEGRLQDGEYPFPGIILKAKADIVVKFDESNFRKGETYFIKEVYGPVSPDEVQTTLNGI